MALELTSLRKALQSLQNALRVASPDELEKFEKEQAEVLKAGVIQNFEFSYELCWKFMRRWLKENLSPAVTDGITRRELFRMAAEQRLIDDVEQWMRYHDARNLSSHTYLPEVADEVYRSAFDFHEAARKLLRAMEERND
jgi:nucleotidyltransferase substrate binding protein (TIGR01987 family)